MALNPSGPISLGGSTAGESIALELGLSATGTISLNDAAVRGLAGVASGAIVMPTDFYGKSNIPSGPLYAWGINNRGQLGVNTASSVSSPTLVAGDWYSWFCGTDFNIGIKSDGSLWNSGKNNRGQWGNDSRLGYRSSPTQVGALTNWAKVTSNDDTVIAIKNDGTLWAWGHNGAKLGDNTTVDRSSPVQIGALTNWKYGLTLRDNTIAVKTDGTLWSWGNNSYGVLGINNLTRKSSPTQIGSLNTWNNIGVSARSAFAVNTSGQLFAWGRNSSGNLGIGVAGPYQSRSSPTQVGALTNWLRPGSYIGSYSGGSRMFCTKTDGTLWVWGAQGYGSFGAGFQTGNPTYRDYRSSPIQAGVATNWVYAVTGGNNVGEFTAAVRSDGTFWMCGGGSERFSVGAGILNYNRSSFVQLGSLTSWRKPFLNSRSVAGVFS